MAYEESHNARLSEFVLREFIQYLADFVRRKNLSPTRGHRLTDEMRALGVHPSPAGIWNYGHKIGIGHKSSFSPNLLIKELLYPLPMSIGKSGLHHGSLYYHSDEVDVRLWSADARNFGGASIEAFTIPSAPQGVWAQLPGDQFRPFVLAPNSSMSAEASLAEHYDVLAAHAAEKKSREHESVRRAIESQEVVNRLKRGARAALKATPIPEFDLTMREARSLEKGHPVPSTLFNPAFSRENISIEAELEAYKALQHSRTLE